MSVIQCLGQVALSASDVALMTEFYRDSVGIPFLFAAGPNLSFFDLGNVRLMIAGLEGEQPAAGNSTLYFKVASVPHVFAHMQGKLNFIDEPHLIAKMTDHELWMVFFKDPEGNLVGFMEERSL
ncbi:MAG: VOC family protein [Fimbriimonadaceae bacterium]